MSVFAVNQAKVDRACEYWTMLMGDFGNPPMADSILAELLTKYGEPIRAYHNLAHIVSMLDELERIEKHQCDITLAVWFHDAIYDPRAKDNEESSATLAVKSIEKLSLAPELGSQVARLIMATRHTEPPEDEPAKLLVDLDLMILGSSEDEFDRYEVAIRKEYEWVPKKEYREARAKILRSFLNRPTIYFTRLFKEKYETRARMNIACSLSRLQIQ